MKGAFKFPTEEEQELRVEKTRNNNENWRENARKKINVRKGWPALSPLPILTNNVYAKEKREWKRWENEEGVW